MRILNQVKTAGLLGLLSGLIVLASYYLVGNESGLYLGLAIAAFMSFSSWYYSDQAALASFRAQPLAPEASPDLYRTIERLSDRAGLPMPKVFVAPLDTPNAFATGRDPDHATIAVTQGLLNSLSSEEIEAVIAHELTHIRNRDTLIQAVAGTLAGGITFLGRILTLGALYGPFSGRPGQRGNNPLVLFFLIIGAPLSAGLIQLAISRTREYAADLGAVDITGDPLALASALQKLEGLSHKFPMRANPAMVPLLTVNPLSKKGLMALFMTHPPTEERIRRLQALAQEKQQETQNTPALAA